MGIRIHKEIGYYLTLENAGRIFVDNYEDILDVDIELSKEKLLKEAEVFQGISGNNLKTIKRQLIRNIEYIKTGSTLYNFIHSINSGYDNSGLILQTQELNKVSRFDDLIDYYEESPVVDEAKIKYIKSAIYPDFWLVCLKDIQLTKDSSEYFSDGRKEKIEWIKKGELFTINELPALSVEGDGKRQSFEKNEWSYPDDGREKLFHPYVSPLLYLILKQINIFKNNEISYVDFIKEVEPAIVTYWS